MVCVQFCGIFLSPFTLVKQLAFFVVVFERISSNTWQFPNYVA